MSTKKEQADLDAQNQAITERAARARRKREAIEHAEADRRKRAEEPDEH